MKKTLLRKYVCSMKRALVFIGAFWLSLHVVAEESKPANSKAVDADTIVKRVMAVPEGEHSTSRLIMKMVDRRGKERVRYTANYRKYFGEEKRTVLFYTEPANVKGTGFLTYDYPKSDVDDDQWLYLPALRKVRRISASDRGDYFLGTDFTYEDIKQSGKIDPRDYNFIFLSEETGSQGEKRYVLEAQAVTDEVAKELGYQKLALRVNPDNWVITQIDYWDTKGKKLKTYTASDIEKIDGIWTRQTMEVNNHISGHYTHFSFKDVDYKTPVNDRKFSVHALNRGP